MTTLLQTFEQQWRVLDSPVPVCAMACVSSSHTAHRTGSYLSRESNLALFWEVIINVKAVTEFQAIAARSTGRRNNGFNE